MTEEKIACLTLDLENDWYFDKPGYDHLTLKYIDNFINIVKSLDVPLTVFVVGKTLERFPATINKLDRELESEFHLHSYQHDTSKSYNFRSEIQNGKDAFASHFGLEPVGYRAPQGNIEPSELLILEQEGFRFDSSVFPSYRPGIYNNLNKPIVPFYPDETNELIEIPIAVSPTTRIPLSHSYLKLFGSPFIKYLKSTSLPNPLVFNIHLQDLYRTASHDQLSQPKNFIFKRNLDRSIEIFTDFIIHLKKKGYSFVPITDIVMYDMALQHPTEQSNVSKPE
jgi:peptidoglycan/xylan/chitin deacetylase (PgdA/CDA1 family)